MPPDRFLTGANLPWLRYGGDFGANAWFPAGGLARRVRSADAARLDRTLADIAGTGARVVRWFIFCDGRAGIRFDAAGCEIALDDRVVPDMDVALDLASRAGLVVLPVLFDFFWCRRERWLNGVQTGGHRRWFASTAHRRALIANVISPFVRHYGHHPAIWGWDILNEPEWVTFGLGTLEPWRSLSETAMRRFLADVTTAIRPLTSKPVTTGLASARWLSLVEGVNLDVYQVHWYDHLEARAPLELDVRAACGDHPVILGEFPTRGSVRTPEAILECAERCGYAGALAWSALATDPASDCEAMLRGLRLEALGSRLSASDLLDLSDLLDPVHPSDPLHRL